VAYWRLFVSTLDPQVWQLTERIGQQVRVVTRFSKAYLGLLHGLRWALDTVEVMTEMREYNPDDQGYYRESKVVSVGMGSISQLEFISEREREVTDQGEDEISRILGQAYLEQGG
jgi:hypothetical protein